MGRQGTHVPPRMVHRWSRVPQACWLCRSKKLRCDRAHPCSNCVQRKIDCTYTDRRNLPACPGPSNATTSSSACEREQVPFPQGSQHSTKGDAMLLGRIQRLEEIVMQQNNQTSSSSTADSSSLSKPQAPASIPVPIHGQRPVGRSRTPISSLERPTDSSSLDEVMNSGQIQQTVRPFGSDPPFELRHLTSVSTAPQDAAALAKCLPPLAQAMELFAHFGRVVHPNIGVLHIPSTRRLLWQLYQTLLDGDEPDVADLALIYSVLAGAALTWVKELLDVLSATREEANSAFSTYSTLALHVLSDQHHTLTSSTVMLQAISTLSYVLSHTEGYSQEVHVLRSQQLFMARSMQIHRLDTSKQREERMVKGSNIIETEVQRRLWWHMVSSDWLLALSGGPNESVYLIHPRHMNVDYPSNVDDENVPSSETQVPLSYPTSMSAFLCRIRLAELCREVVDALPPFLLDSPDVSSYEHEVDYDIVLDLDARFQSFLNALPVFFKLDDQSVQQSRTICRERPYIAWQRTQLHSGINTRICRLHRPFHREGFTNPKYAYSRLMCVRSAETLLNLRGSMEDTGALISVNPSRFWLIAQRVFLATIILATDVSLEPDAPGAAARREEVLAVCRMLEHSQHESATLRKAIQKNTQTLLGILQNQMSLPRSGLAVTGNDIAGESLQSRYPHTRSTGQDPLQNPSAQGTAPPTMVESTARQIQDPAMSMDGDWFSDAHGLSPGDDTWEKLWSNMFNAGLDLDFSQWSSIANDVGSLDYGGDV